MIIIDQWFFKLWTYLMRYIIKKFYFVMTT